MSLIRVVDEVCEGIKAKEKAINILFLSAGLPSTDRRGESIYLLIPNVASTVRGIAKNTV